MSYPRAGFAGRWVTLSFALWFISIRLLTLGGTLADRYILVARRRSTNSFALPFSLPFFTSIFFSLSDLS